MNVPTPPQVNQAITLGVFGNTLDLNPSTAEGQIEVDHATQIYTLRGYGEGIGTKE